MKLIAIMLSIALLCQCSLVSGQSIAFTDNPGTYYTHFNDSSYITHHRRHCITTRIGEGILIGGGVFFAASLGEAAFTKDNNDLAVPLFMFAGLFLGGIGGIVFRCGKGYEKNHKARFTIINKGNQVGLVYNLFTH